MWKMGGGIYDNSRTHKKNRPAPSGKHSMVESFVEQLIDANYSKNSAFRVFMEKMGAAEKSVQEHGFYSEEEVEKELTKI